MEGMQQYTSKISERHVVEQYCHVHSAKTKKPLSVFCETCQKPVCDTCGLTDHKKHDLQDLETSIKNTIDNLKDLSDKLQEKSSPLEQLKGTLDSKMDEISTLRGQREGEIDKCFDGLEAKLRSRCQEAKQERGALCQSMKKTLQEQKVDVESQRVRFLSAVDFADNTCKYANPVDLFQHRNMVSVILLDNNIIK